VTVENNIRAHETIQIFFNYSYFLSLALYDPPAPLGCFMADAYPSLSFASIISLSGLMYHSTNLPDITVWAFLIFLN
jgi:hypothetical protein